MKGYIYTMFRGADPGIGWHMTDPIFGRPPTLGACMPNVRRLVEPGDHIFVISGLAAGVRQYVVGGFAVDEKISALAAYGRFPEHRQNSRPDGSLSGNIIVGPEGRQNPIDYHKGFEKRLENYIVGCDSVSLRSDREVELGRQRTVKMLGSVFKQGGAKTVKDIVGRWRKLNEEQIAELRTSLAEIKKEARD